MALTDSDKSELIGGAAFAALLFVIACIAFGVFGIICAAAAHDLAAWSDPARDQWFRGLKVPGASTSCCNFTDGAAMNPDMVKYRGGAWWVNLGGGFFPVPPERVVIAPISIDGLPYIFMKSPAPGYQNAEGIRCFVPPVGTY